MDGAAWLSISSSLPLLILQFTLSSPHVCHSHGLGGGKRFACITQLHHVILPFVARMGHELPFLPIRLGCVAKGPAPLTLFEDLGVQWGQHHWSPASCSPNIDQVGVRAAPIPVGV